MKMCGVSGGVAPRILNIGIRWRCVFGFTPQPLYLQENLPFSHWIGGQKADLIYFPPWNLTLVPRPPDP
jgi:hypothetical protein